MFLSFVRFVAFRRLVRVALGALVGLGLLPAALACAICAPADGQSTVLFQLHAADTVVIAAADAGASRWRVLALIKGQPPAEGLPLATGTAAGPSLVAYHSASRTARALGAMPLARAGWARQLAGLRPVAVEPPPDWPSRLALVTAELEDPEPLVARIAYEELSVAPYGVMRQLRARWPLDRLRVWTSAPGLEDRWPLYLLLLGVAGGTQDAERIEARLPRISDSTGVPRLSAALAALIELRGAPAVGWLERHLLTDLTRSPSEVQAAVLALGVHAADGERVGRARVVQAYAALLQQNPAQAGLAASDLAAWGEWRFGTRYAEILRSGVPLAFASRYAMVFFLLRSPRPEDRAALQALRAAGHL